MIRIILIMIKMMEKLEIFYLYSKNKFNYFELFLISLFLISFPLSESIKQITFWLLIFIFTLNRFFVKNLYLNYFAKGLLVYLLSSALPILLSVETHLALKWFYSNFIFSMIYIFLINEMKSESKVKILKLSFIIGLLLALFWAITFWKIVWGNPRLEIHSIGAPNATGTYLGICFLYLSWLLATEMTKCTQQNKKAIIFYGVVLLLLLIALILNGSRGMYAGLLGALLYLSLFYVIKEGKYKFFVFFILFISGISVGVLFYPDLSNRFFDTFSLFDRFNNWHKSFSCFLLNPITGGGGKICYHDPDNLIFAILARTGIIGLVSFIYLIYCFFRQFGQEMYRVAFLIFILINGFFETSLKHEPAIAFIFAIFLVKNEKNSNI